MKLASIIQDTTTPCMKVIHTRATLFGWAYSHTFHTALANTSYAGHVPCCVGLADTIRPRKNSWDGTEYAPRL